MISPFLGISPQNKKKLFTLLGVHIYTFDINKNILSTIKNDDVIGIIDTGLAEIRRINYNGEKTVLEELDEDSIFGTDISALNNDDFEIIAKEKTTIIVIDQDILTNPKNVVFNYYNVFIQNMLAIMNERMKNKNERIRILTKKTIRNKLLEYFAIEREKHSSRQIYLPFNFTALSDYLAIDRSAMTRELKYMKEEGFIEIKGKRITLLY